MTTLNVTIKPKSNQGTNVFEGTVTIPGLSPSKLVNKEGKSLFTTVSTLKNVARGVGKRLGAEVTYVEPVKKAAKKSLTKTPKTKTPKTPTTCQQSTCCQNS